MINKKSSQLVDVVVIGAGASGLICASTVANEGHSVLVIDHGKRPGRKLLISGGGRCNFTNYEIDSSYYLSQNNHFVKSALAQFSQWDFIALVAQARIPYQQRSHGQLFCEQSAKDLLNLLMAQCHAVQFCYESEVKQVTQIRQTLDNDGSYGLNYFEITIGHGDAQYQIQAKNLVIATGGLSYPKLGASPLGYKIAQQFGHQIVATRAGLVPFTLQPNDKERYAPLSGIALPVQLSCYYQVQLGKNKKREQQLFNEQLLFTHRGLSGPAILQISNYWQPNEIIKINFIPQLCLIDYLTQMKQQVPDKTVKNVLLGLSLDRNWLNEFETNLESSNYTMPKRVLHCFIEPTGLQDKPLKQLTLSQIQVIAQSLQEVSIKPNNTEGYRTAEVTLGGVATDEIDSKTMQSKRHLGLYFIGEVLDVTGWLGGYNLQWAWSSGVVAGRHISYLLGDDQKT